MSNPFNGPISRLWVGWKSLTLPWRKQRLAGYDLNGNTFWEFKDTVRSDRWRRIARQPRAVDYADIQISPQWHQWLRHTRPEAPSIAEQQADAQRRLNIKVLAQQADARWSNQQSYLRSPESVGTAGQGGAKNQVPTETGVEQAQGNRSNQETWETQRGVRENWQGREDWQPGNWKGGSKG